MPEPTPPHAEVDRDSSETEKGGRESKGKKRKAQKDYLWLPSVSCVCVCVCRISREGSKDEEEEQIESNDRATRKPHPTEKKSVGAETKKGERKEGPRNIAAIAQSV